MIVLSLCLCQRHDYLAVPLVYNIQRVRRYILDKRIYYYFSVFCYFFTFYIICWIMMGFSCFDCLCVASIPQRPAVDVDENQVCHNTRTKET